MYVDAHNLFSDEQAVTADAGSTNIIDLGQERYIGTGQDIYCVVQVDEAFTDAGSDSTVTVTIQSDTDVAFGSAATFQTIGTFAALTAVGSRMVVKLNPDIINERYIRLFYDVNNGNLSTGKFTAFLTVDIQAFRAFADGFTIS